MKENELMVGDWVRYKGIENRIAPADFMHFDWIRDIEPIPLTPEILEKNGFVKEEEMEGSLSYHILIPTGYEKNTYTIQITFYKEPICGVHTLFKCWGWAPPHNGGINDIHICNLNSVHQIQHVLRLLGIQKDIEL